MKFNTQQVFYSINIIRFLVKLRLVEYRLVGALSHDLMVAYYYGDKG